VRWGLKGIEVERDAEAAARRGGTRDAVLKELRAIPTRGRGLWVDDRPEDNVAVIRLLRGRGVDIDVAATNAGAVELARRANEAGELYAFVVSDIGRENEDGPRGGLDLLGLLQQALAPPPPVVFYTSTALDTGIANTVSTATPAALFAAIAGAMK
jgi:CheY-like chemotaxis protein